jgi:hypothetical protein
MWKTSLLDHSGETSIIVGQHNVTVSRLNVPVSCPEVAKPPVELPPVKIITTATTEIPPACPRPSAEIASQLIHFTLRYPATVTHDFSRNRLCPIDVSMDLFNCTEVTLNVDVDMQQFSTRSSLSTQPSSDSVYNERQPQAFLWSGQTVTRLQLGPRDSRVLQLCACFITTGTYDLLSSVRVTAGCLSDDVEMVPQRALSSSWIVIGSEPVAMGITAAQDVLRDCAVTRGISDLEILSASA